MTPNTHSRTDAVSAHAYTLPVVREVPVGAAAPAVATDVQGLPQPVAYAADAHAW